MQIPSIREFFTSETSYFLESSWKERTVQVLCVVSFLTLIYYAAFRYKKADDTSTQEPPALDNRVSTTPPLEGMPDPSSLPEKPQENIKKCGFKTRAIIFKHWLSVKIRACDTWMTMSKGSYLQKRSCRAVLQAEISELKAQLAIMIPVFQACPEVQTEDWDAFLRGCLAIADGQEDLTLCCNKIEKILKKLQPWNVHLQSTLAKKAEEEPDFWDLYHFNRLVAALSVTCDRLIRKQTGSLLKNTLYFHALRTFLPELRDQVEKMISDFQPYLQHKAYLDGFVQKHYAIVYRKTGLRTSCKGLKERLTSIQSRSKQLLSCYEMTENPCDSDFLKAFLKDFKRWLFDKIKSCDDLIPWAKGSSFQPDICKETLKTFIPELKEQVKKMIRFLQAYTEIKTEALAAFMKNCDQAEAKAANSKDLEEYCLSIRRGLEQLQSWSASVLTQPEEQ